MIDETTQTNETENSEGETSTSETEQKPSDTSTTQETETEEKIDLGTGKGAETTETEDTRTDEEKARDAERETMFGAPAEGETYQIEGLPEGTEIDTEALEAITPVARQLGLSNKGLSTIAGVYAEKVLPGVAAKVVEQLNKDVLDRRAEWETEARDLIAGKGEPLKNAAGEVVGFDGKAMGQVQQIAAKALDRLAPQGFREWLDETGLGVHPQMIAFAYNAGKAIAEDRDVEPVDRGGKKKSGDGRPMTDASKFYDR